MVKTAPNYFKPWKPLRSESPGKNCCGARWEQSGRVFRRCREWISSRSRNGRRDNLSGSKIYVCKWRGKRFARSWSEQYSPGSRVDVRIAHASRRNSLFRKVRDYETQSVRGGLASLAGRVCYLRQEFCVFRSSARALRFMKASIALILALTASLFGQAPPQKHPFTFEDMMKLKRVGAPVPSPDGKWVLFDAEDVDLEANTKTSHLWIVLASGGESRRLNQTANHEERPRLSPDGKRLIWTSKAADPTQIWMCDFDTNAGVLVGQPHQVTNISTGADGGIWSPDGKNIVFVSAVYPDCKDDACNKERDEELKKSKVKAKIFSRLFYRHWSSFTEFKRSHLFVVDANARADRSTDVSSVGPAGVSPAESQTPDKMSGGPTGKMPVLQPRDLTPGDHDVPPFNLGGQDMYAISPDGQEVAYTSNIDEVEATSTNNEIFGVAISGGTAKKISTSPGADTTPLYSPDRKYLAWRSQARAGFEADKWRLLVQDRQSGKTRDLTEQFDRSVGSFAWQPDSPAIAFSAEDRGEAPLFVMPIVLGLKEPLRVQQIFHADDLAYGSNRQLYVTRMSIAAPNEIWGRSVGLGIDKASPWRVTHMNDALLSQIDMQPLESF